MVRIKKYFLIFAALFLMSTLTWRGIDFCKAEEDSTPEWVKRINFSLDFQTDKHPVFYFETVQPFYQSPDQVNTFFYQPRVSLSAGDFTYNFGAGYRRVFSDNLLCGLNFFGDYEDLHEHGRTGFGLEALTQTLEARVNGYFAVTSKRVVEEGGANIIFERVTDGCDFELGTPLPYLPWLKCYASGFWYDFDKISDKVGWKSRLEVTLSDYLLLEFYTWDDNKGEQEFGGKGEVRIAFDNLSDFKQVFKLSNQAFPKKDLKKATLIPVEREFDITVEKWSETTNGDVTVVIGRTN